MHPAVLLVAAAVCAAPSPGREEIAARKEALSLRLDSLEMLKQERKAAGESLVDLERAAAALRDSIESLRSRVENLSAKGVLPAPERPAGRSFGVAALARRLKGRSVFDWVILAVGIVAVVAGVVLVVGLVRTVFGGKRTRRRPPGPSERPRRRVPPAGGASASTRGADIDKEGIESLRRRVAEDARREREAEHLSPGGLSGTGGGADAGNGDTLRDRILNAANQGLDVAQISRRFHISVDQVALILRVARNGKRNS
ncbi:MAG: hypothetical protein GF418_01565 [Chitinivibrionales bacterium]|nr:hypothetical protein [Chitinivibrionales bacterium]MBD3394290.1 hypothetical protein [Chitinivibrionales bacterium]